MKKASRRAQLGFTLIEVVLAVGIMGIILTVAYSSLTHIIRAKQALDDERDLGTIANAIIGRMSRELQLATSGDNARLLPPPNQPEKIQTNSLLGEDKQSGSSKGGDSITFVASEGGQYVPDGLSHSGLVQITYRVEEDPEQRFSDNPTFYLIRDEIPHIRPVEKAYEKKMTFPITRDLIGMSLMYYDSSSEQWVKSWDDSKRDLPKMIFFMLQVRSPRGQILTFATTVTTSAI